MSRMPIRFDTPRCDAFAIVSQIEPSTNSESPISAQTRAGDPSSRIANASPNAIGRP